MANIKRIKYAAKAPTYNFANQMIEMEAELLEAEDPIHALNDLIEIY